MIGKKLGPYEILDLLGKGGMGEVYRARDPRLGREVAIKILPQGLADHPEVRARFLREAKTVSSLNSPFICTLHDVGREEGVDFLVMELIEGETLADRLQKGPLPVAEALKIGGQIADALDRAHRAGVIHRDLKPGNVMLTRGGAKLLDFGLARATGLTAPGDATEAALSQSPTVAQPLTAEGTILGTYQYMAPEQLEGGEIDARADLWAFGCVLHEMVTGHRAFEGRSQASVIGAIMRTDPQPVSSLLPLAPPALDGLVRACLAKDPDERVQSAHDLKLQLAWIAEGASSVSGAPAVSPLPSGGRRRWLAPALAGLLGALAAAVVVWNLQPPPPTAPAPAQAQRYTVGRANLRPQSAPVFSPDGRSLVYAVREAGGGSRIYRRDLSSLTASPIAGTEEGWAPFFSPDGGWLGFVTPTALKKVPAPGGVAQVVCNLDNANSGEWGADGWIWFTASGGGADGLTALYRVRDTGGSPESVAALDTLAGDQECWLPEVLPDGRRVLITVSGGDDVPWKVQVVDPEGGRRTVVENALLARYSDTGHLVWFDFQSQAVLAAPFDADRAELTGPAVALTEPVDASYAFGLDGRGRLAYVPVPGVGEGAEVVWTDRQGRATPLVETPAEWVQPRLSPDGTRLILRKVGTYCELWLYDLQRGTLGRLVQGNDAHDPIWSPDGRWVAYQQQVRPLALVLQEVVGGRSRRVLEEGSHVGRPESWSAGHDLLATTVDGRGTRSDIWLWEMGQDAQARPYLATPAEETQPALSPDGEWMAYVSDETGTPEVYVRTVPDQGASWQVSLGGGNAPLWAHDGSELYFVHQTRMMAVGVETEPSLRLGSPEVLFEGGFDATRADSYDVTDDGRFVTIRRAGGEEWRGEIRILLDWPAEMARVEGTP